jgi:hypothetical protein
MAIILPQGAVLVWLWPALRSMRDCGFVGSGHWFEAAVDGPQLSAIDR